MKKYNYSFLILLLIGYKCTMTQAQTASSGSYLTAKPIPDRTVTFRVSDEGVSKPIIWGLDTAWPSEENIRRGVAYMGAERVSLVRGSFQPTHPLVDGDLQQEQKNWIKTRLKLIDLTGEDTKVVLNCDHPSVDPWYEHNASHWAELMDVTTRYFQEGGRTIVSIAPFNEPDFGWGQGDINDFYNIAGLLRENPRFENIRICGGNTLNADQALPWYNQLKDRLDEGNTHQLAGSFDSYANFFTTVRANGHHATADELHNVMEAIVGVEYGMQTGIWWGTAELTRGEFVKASYGKRLGYAEHRPNWTAAAVYRSPEGKIQAFGGTSERQAATTTYRFFSADRDVYFDGKGPMREYVMELPGGTDYQQGQTNAECVVNITWGDDIQPVIDGRYAIVNRNSGMAMEVIAGSTEAGANVRQQTYRNATYQQWNVVPVSNRIGGDFSYFTFKVVHNGMALDVLNWSLEDKGNVIVYNAADGANQQWFLEYAEDGWFYIRNRHSAKCLQVFNSSTAQGANIQQGEKTGATNQQWRFVPVGAAVEFTPPAAPQQLVATANAASIRLNWSANTESDLAGYNVFRAESLNEGYNLIARGVTSSSFVDNTVCDGTSYYYRIKAVDKSLNSSEYSNEVVAAITGDKTLVAHFLFEDDTQDQTINLNHGSPYGVVDYVERQGTKAVKLDGETNFIQLPTDIVNHKAITIATWVKPYSISTWQRIFDFGNGEDENMFLARSDNRKLRFAIKKGDEEQQLDAPSLSVYKWTHVAVTLGEDGAKIYINGELSVESSAITLRPTDFKPVLNYIGRSQYPDPLFKGEIDDFRVYNYALSANEVADIATVASSISEMEDNASFSTLSVYDMVGRRVVNKEVVDSKEAEVKALNLPAGIYTLQWIGKGTPVIEKIIIK